MKKKKKQAKEQVYEARPQDDEKKIVPLTKESKYRR